MDDKLIPNGSVVVLNGGDKKLMIYGRKQVLMNDEGDTMYDYLAVPYPEGDINPDYAYVFNDSDIHEVIFTGFVNEEEEEFQKVLKDA